MLFILWVAMFGVGYFVMVVVPRVICFKLRFLSRTTKSAFLPIWIWVGKPIYCLGLVDTQFRAVSMVLPHWMDRARDFDRLVTLPARVVILLRYATLPSLTIGVSPRVYSPAGIWISTSSISTAATSKPSSTP